MKQNKFLFICVLGCLILTSCNSGKTKYEKIISDLEEKNSKLVKENNTLVTKISNLENENLELQKTINELNNLKLNEYLKILKDFSLTLDKEIQEKVSYSYYNEYNRFFNMYFMQAVIDSNDKTIVNALLEIINSKADKKDDYGIFSQEGDPLTLAVVNDNFELVKFISEKSPQFITLVHNGGRGGCQDWQILDLAKSDEMKNLLISLGANTKIAFEDNGWLRKDCIIYNTIEDVGNGIGSIGEEGKSIFADARIYVFNKKENQYKELYRLKNFTEKNYAYAVVSDVKIDPDL